jgi:hypothetical protein
MTAARCSAVAYLRRREYVVGEGAVAVTAGNEVARHAIAYMELMR